MKSIRRNGPGLGLAAMPALLLLSAAFRMAAAPQIAVDNPIYDFGSVINGSQILHDFVIRNAGDSELDISHVDSSCAACLQASLEKSKIPPGGRSVLHARLDLRLLNGTVSRAVAIGSNDPNNDLVLVGFTGEVVPLYQITPPEIQIDLSRGRQTAAVEIAPMVNLHAPLSQVVCDDKDVTATLSPGEDGRFVLTVQALDSLPRGNTRVRLALRTADPDDPPCSVVGLIRNPPDLESDSGKTAVHAAGGAANAHSLAEAARRVAAGPARRHPAFRQVPV